MPKFSMNYFVAILIKDPKWFYQENEQCVGPRNQENINEHTKVQSFLKQRLHDLLNTSEAPV